MKGKPTQAQQAASTTGLDDLADLGLPVVTGETHAYHWCEVEDEGNIQLNRRWIYRSPEEDDEAIGEVNFVIPATYFEKIFPELFPNTLSVGHFLTWYIPEEDGEKIYLQAKADGKIIEEYLYFENQEDVPDELADYVKPGCV